MKILCKNETVLYVGKWNRTRLMTLTLVLMSLFSFQVANAQGSQGGGGGGRPGGGTVGDLICKGCVDASDIAKSAVTNSKIKKGAVSNSKLGSGAVSASKLASRAVTTSKIQDGAVTVSKVAPQLRNAIGTFCPPGESVVGMDLGGNFVCESKLAQVLDPDLTGKTYCLFAQGVDLVAAENPNWADIEFGGFRSRMDFTSPTQVTHTIEYNSGSTIHLPANTITNIDDVVVPVEGTYTVVGSQLAATFYEDGQPETGFATLTPDGQVFVFSFFRLLGVNSSESQIIIGVQATSCY